jgi:pimeloyl-ACP methyl ester carboxylesterase
MSRDTSPIQSAEVEGQAPARSSLRSELLGLALAAALALGGACRSPVGVTRTGFEPNFRSQRASVLDEGELSSISRQLLAYTGLAELYGSDPEAALARLRKLALSERVRRPLVVVAELEYARALSTGERGRYLLAAVDAYHYLFSTELEPAPDPFDPLFQLACDLYNRGLTLGLMGEGDELDLSDRVIETPRGSLSLVGSTATTAWGRDDFARFLPADAYQVRGLRDRVRLEGLGVPLIAQLRDAAGDDPLRRNLPPRLILSATALLRPEGGVAELESGALRCSLELYFPTDIQRVEIAGQYVPLEGDLTAPMAYSLEDSPIWGFSIRGFLRGSDEKLEAGVYMTQPYQRGKIPVLLLHGTASNPAEWAPLVSGLQLDPRLRAKYQLWVGLYRTGNPILYSAAVVRGALKDLLDGLNAGGDDPALQQMIVVGHSQGGLLTRLLATSSGDRFWNLISSEPFDQYELSPEAREVLGRSLFFEPVPAISRVVFISTPHRGSFLAASWIGRLTYGLVQLPGEVTNSLRQLGSADRLPPELRSEIPTSVKNMDPGSPFVKVLETLPFGERVHLHSIIPVKGDGPPEEGDDGVVAYSSAHLEGVESELVVRHSHSCQNEPETVLELRRILLAHLASLDAASPPAQAAAKP